MKPNSCAAAASSHWDPTPERTGKSDETRNNFQKLYGGLGGRRMKLAMILAHLRGVFDISQSLRLGAVPLREHLAHVIELDLAFRQHLGACLGAQRVAINHLESQFQTP